MFKSVKSLSVSLDKIVKRERCVRFVCDTAIHFITVGKDVVQTKDKISVFARKCFEIEPFVDLSLPIVE